MSCIRGGFGGAELDMAGALAATAAHGVPAEAAAVWLAEFAAGMVAGIVARKERDEAPGHQQRR